MFIASSLDTPSYCRTHFLTKRRLSRSLALLLVTFFLFGLWHAVRVNTPRPREVGDPIGNMSIEQYNPDEISHVATIYYIARHVNFPPYRTKFEKGMYSVSFHPPAYHFAAAAIWRSVSTVANAHQTVLTLRLFGLLMGLGTVWYTYGAARLLVSRQTALLAAACVAGVPMFVSTSAAVTNENLSALSASAAWFWLICGTRIGFSRDVLLRLALWTALGVCSKLTCVGLLPAAAYVIWWAGRRQGLSLQAIGAQAALVVGASVLAVGWFLLRNMLLYGDLFRFKSWELDYGATRFGIDRAHLLGESTRSYLQHVTTLGYRSFWGVFDHLTARMPGSVYALLMLLNACCVAGLARLYRQGRIRHSGAATLTAVLIMAATLFYQFYKFNLYNFTPQGRYFFPLLVPFGIGTAAGWRALFPRSWQRRASWALCAGLLLLNVFVAARYPGH